MHMKTTKTGLLWMMLAVCVGVRGQSGLADITISTSATSNGTWSGGSTGPYEFTPSAGAGTANINVADIAVRLCSNDNPCTAGGYTPNHVTIGTANVSGSGNGDITISAALTAGYYSDIAYTLTLSAGRHITVNANSTINLTPAQAGNGTTGRQGHSLTMNAGTGGSVTVLASITVTGGLAGGGSGASGGAGGNVTLNAGTGGSVTISAGITANGSDATKGSGGNAGDITISGPGGVSLSANLSAMGGNGTTGSGGGVSGNGGIITISSGNTTVTTGGGENDGQTAGAISCNAGGTGTSIGTHGQLIKEGSGTMVLSQANSVSGGTILNAGQLNINHATALGDGTFTINGGAIDNTSGSSITLTNNNTQNWNGDFSFVGANALNLGTGAITLTTHTQVNVAAGTLTAVGTINHSNLNLTKTGDGVLAFGSQAITLRSLTVSAGSVTSTSGTMNLYGDLSGSGSFVHNNGTVALRGSLPQSIAGTFYNLTVNNTAAASAIALTGAVSVNNNLTLTDGHVLTTAINILKLGANATLTLNAPVTQDSSFIKGPMTHTVSSTSSTAKTFPVGKGNRMHRLVLTLTHDVATATEYTSEYVAMSAAALGYTLPSTLDLASSIGYWEVGKNGGSTVSAAQARLYYGPDDVVSDPANLRAAKDDGSGAWLDLGGAGNLMDNGYVTSSVNFTEFGKFAFANNTGGGNLLPVDLLVFKATAVGSGVELQWLTGKETDNSYFTVERSQNGEAFEFVTRVSGAGTADHRNIYQASDPMPYKGTSYYRLAQTDVDGKSSRSHMVAVRIEGDLRMSLYPNPVRAGQALHVGLADKSDGLVEIRVNDICGRQINTARVSLSGSDSFDLPVELTSAIPAGSYSVTLIHNGTVLNLILVVE